MILSTSQYEAFTYITTNLQREKVILLEGSAGTGKTTLTKNICMHYNEIKNIQVCAITPTHKAKKVIHNILNRNTIIPVATLTIASALGKIREHSYVGTKTYSNGNNKKLSLYKLFIIDEVSMINDRDLKIIIEYSMTTNKQILLIGDSNQIPCPVSKYEEKNNIVQKSDSFVFTDPKIKKIKLTEIMRQSLESPIIKLAVFMRDELLTDHSFEYMIDSTKFNNIIKCEDIYETFKLYYDRESPNSCRIIAYTNASVKTHNLEVRNAMEYEGKYVIGELMMGYSNVGCTELIIENGEDYIIKRITPVVNHKINIYNNLVGYLIDLNIANTKTIIKNQFFININDENNIVFINKLIELAEKINSAHSNKFDYLEYMMLKNSVIFTEDIYKYEERIFTETTLREAHALLFVNINEVIVNGKMTDTQMSEKINTAYPNIIIDRINDKYKPMGESEQFADRYKMIEKDMYYGYSITAHKSQGSTYNVAIVDEDDFQKIQNRWNYKYNKYESRIKEKNQLRYVAYTRAKTQLFLSKSSKEIDQEIDQENILSICEDE